MATGTTLDLITAALKRIGAISGIETPVADLAQDSLARLNELVESWSTENLTLWTQVATTATGLLANQPFYTVGPAGMIPVTNRPAWIDSVSWMLPGSTPIEYKLTPMFKTEWEQEHVKQLTSTQATHFYYQADYPVGSLMLWPRPSSTFSLLVYLPQTVNTPATLSTVLTVPPGYWRALRDALALELAPEVGRPVDPALVQSAIDAKAQLQRTNFRPRLLGMPAGIATGDRGGWDWRTD
jgi:hypothetical protein